MQVFVTMLRSNQLPPLVKHEVTTTMPHLEDRGGGCNSPEEMQRVVRPRQGWGVPLPQSRPRRVLTQDWGLQAALHTCPVRVCTCIDGILEYATVCGCLDP